MNERDCYHCTKYNECRLRWTIKQATREHAEMLTEDYEGIARFNVSIAPLCACFNPVPEGEEL